MTNLISGFQVLFVMTLLFSFFAFGGLSPVRADDPHGDRNGFRDQDGQYHRYEYHHHHRGYWNQRPDGVRLWINA